MKQEDTETQTETEDLRNTRDDVLCMSGDVEDEKHFVLDCVVYEDLRRKMFEVVKRVLLKNEEIEDEVNSEAGRQRILGAILGDGGEESEGRTDLRRAAMEYCRQAMKRRHGVVVSELDQRT